MGETVGRGDCRDASKRVYSVASFHGYRVTLLANRIPIVILLEFNGRRDGEESGNITGALPFVIVYKGGGARLFGFVTPTHYERLKNGLDFFAGIEEGGALGCA